MRFKEKQQAKRRKKREKARQKETNQEKRERQKRKALEEGRPSRNQIRKAKRAMKQVGFGVDSYQQQYPASAWNNGNWNQDSYQAWAGAQGYYDNSQVRSL